MNQISQEAIARINSIISKCNTTSSYDTAVLVSELNDILNVLTPSGAAATAPAAPAPVASSAKLYVTFPDGTVISEKRATDTFVAVVNKLGATVCYNAVNALTREQDPKKLLFFENKQRVITNAPERGLKTLNDGLFLDAHGDANRLSKKIDFLATILGVKLKVVLA